MYLSKINTNNVYMSTMKVLQSDHKNGNHQIVTKMELLDKLCK